MQPAPSDVSHPFKQSASGSRAGDGAERSFGERSQAQDDSGFRVLPVHFAQQGMGM